MRIALAACSLVIAILYYLWCSDDEQPKPKPRSSLLSDTPQLIPAEDVSPDEEAGGVS